MARRQPRHERATRPWPRQLHWYHVALVYDGAAGTFDYYLDGSLEVRVPALPRRLRASAAAFGDGPAGRLDGAVDGVRWVPRALPPSEIGTLVGCRDCIDGVVSPPLPTAQRALPSAAMELDGTAAARYAKHWWHPCEQAGLVGAIPTWRGRDDRNGTGPRAVSGPVGSRLREGYW